VLTQYFKRDPVPFEPTLDEMLGLAGELQPMVADVAALLQEARARGQSLLFEGAQGALLDIDHGTYPYVTSSHCLAGFAPPSCGLPARALDGVIGVLKAYTTRVGSGPFPTELGEAIGEHLRRRGNEFGTTTGRPRRTGWFDAVASRASMRWNGIDAVALTKLDVLDEVDEIRIATSYRIGDTVTDEFPDDAADLLNVEPVYETMPGWKSSSSGVTTYEKLPEAARRYVERLEELLGAPAALISTGPRREETIVRAIEPLTRWLPELTARRRARKRAHRA